MIPSGPDIALRALGTALAGVSIAFAGYMLAYGGGKVRVLGMEHLAIFAQPRGPAIIAASPPSRRRERNRRRHGGDRIGRRTRAESARQRPGRRSSPRAAIGYGSGWTEKSSPSRPARMFPGLGRIGAILRRDGGWMVLDDKGATLLTLAGPANGAALFSRKLIFD